MSFQVRGSELLPGGYDSGILRQEPYGAGARAHGEIGHQHSGVSTGDKAVGDKGERVAGPATVAAEADSWAAWARQSGYRVGILAQRLGHSSRWLELLCRRQFHLTPRAWLAGLGDQEIQRLARTSMPAKTVSQLVGFANTASFCRSLKRSAGCTLRELRRMRQNGGSQKDNKKGSLSIWL